MILCLQASTTNQLVLKGVSKLSNSLKHFVWGFTLELIKTTDLLINQSKMSHNDANPTPQQNRSTVDKVPIYETVLEPTGVGLTFMKITPLPKLYIRLMNRLPTTKTTFLKVPFRATWRQTISNYLSGTEGL